MFLEKLLSFCDIMFFVPLSDTPFASSIIEFFEGTKFGTFLEFYLDVPLVGFILLDLLFLLFAFKLLKSLASMVLFFFG